VNKVFFASFFFRKKKMLPLIPTSSTTHPSLPRHCERSEAIQLFLSAMASVILCDFWQYTSTPRINIPPGDKDKQLPSLCLSVSM
jgi:hypothetical protein